MSTPRHTPGPLPPAQPASPPRPLSALSLSRLWRRDLGPHLGRMVLITLVMALVAIPVLAMPGRTDRARVDHLGTSIATAPLPDRDVTMTAFREPWTEGLAWDERSLEAVSDQLQQISEVAGQPLLDRATITARMPWGGVEGDGDPGQTLAHLMWLNDADERLTLTAGRWPSTRAPADYGSTEHRPDPSDDPKLEPTLDKREHTIEVAIPVKTADYLGLTLGDGLRIVPEYIGADNPAKTIGVPYRATIVGIYQPASPQLPVWADIPSLSGPEPLTYLPKGMRIAMLADPHYPEALRLAARGALSGGGEIYELTWTAIPRPEAVTREALPTLSAMRALMDQISAPTGMGLTKSSDLAALASTYQADDAAAQALIRVLLILISGLSTLLLLLLARWATSDRSGQMRLHLARGGSAWQVYGLVASQLALALIAGIALAYAVARWGLGVTPGSAESAAVLAMGLVPLASLAATVYAESRALRRTSAGTPVAVRPALLVGLIGLLTATGFGIQGLRATSLLAAGGTEQSSDWTLAAVPLLAAVSVAALAVLITPVLLRVLTRLAARWPGVGPLVGFGRASRDGRVLALPMAIGIVALALAGFSAALSHSLRVEQDRAAWGAVGGDVRIAQTGVDRSWLTSSASTPGVHRAVPAFVEPRPASPGSQRDAALLVGVDLAAYAELVAGTPLALSQPPTDAGDPADLAIYRAPDPGSKLADNNTRPAGDGHAYRVEISQRRVRSTIADSDPGLTWGADRQTSLFMASLSDLERMHSGVSPNTVLLRADEAAAATLSGDARALEHGTSVLSRYQVRDALRGNPLPRLLGLMLSFTTWLALGTALLALASMVGLTSARRSLTLSAMRALGLGPRQRRSIVIAELFPVVALIIGLGALTGLALPRLLGDSLDLAAFSGGRSHPPITQPWTTALAIGAVAALAVLATVTFETWRAKRRPVSTILRTGDST